MWIFIQARTKSKRLPNKIMEPIEGKPVLEHVIANCKQVTNSVVVLVPKGDPVISWLIENNIMYHEGSENDVLSRFYNAAVTYSADFFIRITSDCPLVPSDQMLFMTQAFIANKFNFMTNSLYIDGQDIEICDFKTIDWLQNTVTTEFDREHVFTYITSNIERFSRAGFLFSKFKPAFLKEWFPKLSIDTQEDLDRVRKWYDSGYC